MAMLIENQELYQTFENTIKNIHFEIHAIYEPDESEEPYQDCYFAAVDLFESGMTFRVYFKTTEAGKIEVEYMERWYFG